MTIPIRITDLIHFHGLTLLVYSDGEHRYIEARPLVDLAGINWRSALRTLAQEDSIVLYGTKRLNLPKITTDTMAHDQNRRTSATENSLNPSIKAANESAKPEGILCFRLDRARGYLYSINTTHMKAKGNVTAAEALLALQIEWAEVLHAYETHGIAVKKGQDNPLNDLSKLMKLRSQAHKGPEQEVITQLIHQQLADMGHPIHREPDLFTS